MVEWYVRLGVCLAGFDRAAMEWYTGVGTLTGTSKIEEERQKWHPLASLSPGRVLPGFCPYSRHFKISK